MKLDGRRIVLFGGEYQFWRTPSPDRWPAILAEMRAAGLNTVTVGVSWQYHSPARGVYDFTGIRDLGRFLDDAAAAGLYVIARPGPAYNAESSASNLPGWLLSESSNLRANSGHAYCGGEEYSPVYAAAYTDWFRHVLPIIAARRYTHGGGTVIALQIENEYSPRCGNTRYMGELHDLARELGIDVPLIANNNICCTNAGSWYISGDDGQPIVDIPAEDDYPCPNTCGPDWGATAFQAIDTLETRLRGAGLTAAPIAVAELQGGYFSGWGGRPYSALTATLGPSFREVIDGSVLGQGATIVSIYMVAGGTSWGYLAGPNTATSYDYGAPIHEWGTPGPAYGALKRTAMFVDAFGDVMAATRASNSVAASDRSVLYAVRETVDGVQRGARFIVLRNADPHRSAQTRLRLTIGRTGLAVPHNGTIAVAPHSLSMLLADYHIGPAFHLLYSTSRPLTRARVNGSEIMVLYGEPGTPGETALAFARKPAILRADSGIAVSYDRRSGELRLNYRHDGTVRYVALSYAGRHLVLALTDTIMAARTWRLDTVDGQSLIIGPRLVESAQGADGFMQVSASADSAMPTVVWSPAGAGHLSFASAPSAVRPHVGAARQRNAVSLRRPLRVSYDAALGASLTTIETLAPRMALPQLLAWRFEAESYESARRFDDSAWRRADERVTSNPNVPRTDTLLADDYGFHYGFVWYRGTFRGSGSERYLRLYARNSYSVWLNGRYLGSSTPHNDLKNSDDQLTIYGSAPNNATYADGLFYTIPSHLIHRGAGNTIAVLVESLGHNMGFANGERARSPIGILDALLISSHGASPHISWTIQGGDASYASVHDGVDSPLNTSGLYGERNGWYRPGFDDRSWQRVTTPDTWTRRGLALQGVGWYRTNFALNLPQGVKAPIGLVIPHAQDKVLIWLNGLLIGQYWEGVGPQHMFYLPAGLLREHGRNTLALAVWNRGHSGGLTDGVYLQTYDAIPTVSLGFTRR